MLQKLKKINKPFHLWMLLISRASFLLRFHCTWTLSQASLIVRPSTHMWTNPPAHQFSRLDQEARSPPQRWLHFTGDVMRDLFPWNAPFIHLSLLLFHRSVPPPLPKPDPHLSIVRKPSPFLTHSKVCKVISSVSNTSQLDEANYNAFSEVDVIIHCTLSLSTLVSNN